MDWWSCSAGGTTLYIVFIFHLYSSVLGLSCELTRTKLHYLLSYPRQYHVILNIFLLYLIAILLKLRDVWPMETTSLNLDTYLNLLTHQPPVPHIFGFSFLLSRQVPHFKYVKDKMWHQPARFEKSWPPFCQIWIIFTRLKLWIASARHNFKWVEIHDLVFCFLLTVFVTRRRICAFWCSIQL